MCCFGALPPPRTHCLLEQPLGPLRNFKVLYRQSFAGPPNDVAALGANIDALGDTAGGATQARGMLEQKWPALRVVRSRWRHGIGASHSLPARPSIRELEPIALAVGAPPPTATSATDPVTRP